jgi:[glutamine synthetase] adenylyltransferase / [glutamine synthetase]-adenylyl-L-tyrosine phosphorylase
MVDLGFFEKWFQASPSPNRARNGLLQWLNATGNPSLYLEQLRSAPEYCKALLNLVAASPAMCDLLAQNPELASLYLEEQGPPDLPSYGQCLRQGQQLLESSQSYQHSLDRLRYLKQRKLFRIALIDVNEWQPATHVWRALSDLADAVLVLTHQVAWEYHCRMRMLEVQPCPVQVIAFGKHGGREVNYSSDLDLVFVLDDGIDEKLEREALRFCEAYIKAMTDRMGRGALYRIDMRLRPYGAAGELAKSMRATESYYKLYAEAWEVQALIRSRPVIASSALAERWEQMRRHHCFKAHVSEFTLDTILETRERIDHYAKEEDFKRSRGGIRDIEFTVQTLQLVSGHRYEATQVPGTIPALHALCTSGLISPCDADFFESEYTWLRQLEHRCQLLHDQQVHTLPSDSEDLSIVERLIGSQNIHGELQARRELIAKTYFRFNHSNRQAEAEFELGHAHQFLGAKVDAAVLENLLRSNEGSFRRLSVVMQRAPALQQSFQVNWPLGEALLSGEIEEDDQIVPSLENLAILRTKLFASWTLNGAGDPALAWTNTCRNALIKACRESQIPHGVEIVFLGSAGIGQMTPDSDIDAIFLAQNEESQAMAEAWIPKLLTYWESSKITHANPVNLDLRLRPEGSKGLIVRTEAALRHYAKTDMESWERYMLGFTDSHLLQWLNEIPWTEQNEQELMIIKRRVEDERVSAETSDRDVKIGRGALMDIQWIVRLQQLRQGTQGTFEELLQGQHEAIGSAYRFFQELRIVLQLRGLGDIIPDDSVHANSIALQMGFPNAEALWQKNDEMRLNVRTIFQDVVANR